MFSSKVSRIQILAAAIFGVAAYIAAEFVNFYILIGTRRSFISLTCTLLRSLITATETGSIGAETPMLITLLWIAIISSIALGLYFYRNVTTRMTIGSAFKYGITIPWIATALGVLPLIIFTPSSFMIVGIAILIASPCTLPWGLAAAFLIRWLGNRSLNRTA